MERFSTCELREKEVINLCDGARLGTPCDFEFDVCDGKITALIVPQQGSCHSVEPDRMYRGGRHSGQADAAGMCHAGKRQEKEEKFLVRKPKL